MHPWYIISMARDMLKDDTKCDQAWSSGVFCTFFSYVMVKESYLGEAVRRHTYTEHYADTCSNMRTRVEQT
jgi:hypothetical protein